ncbi:MAG TPA: acyltransferase family protein, partial [Puia sp.]
AVARYNRKLIHWLIWISLATSSVTGLFLFHFALGLFIGAYFDRYNSEAIRQTFWYRYRVWLCVLALPLFSMRYWTKIMPIGGYTLYDFFDYLKLDFFHLSALVSFIFIICLIHYGRLRRAFQAPFLVYIGKISYGIYLVHYVLVSAMGDYWESDILPLFPNAPVALAVSAVVCFALTILLASIVHYWVELPFIRLGKRVVKKMKPTIGI